FGNRIRIIRSRVLILIPLWPLIQPRRAAGVAGPFQSGAQSPVDERQFLQNIGERHATRTRAPVAHPMEETHMNKATGFGRMAAGLGAIALGVIGIGWASSDALAAPACASLATDPQYGLLGNPVIKSVTSAKTTTPAPGNVQYCRVTLVYGTDPNQNITIAVGLPLSAADGGTGGIQGAWNGRTEGLGGGGCSGNTNVNAAVNARYVGSGTDGGHVGGDCTPGVNLDGTYNLEFIEDFFRVGIKQEILWSKQIAATYYGEQPVYNYWNGCSTGGRQGYLLA